MREKFYKVDHEPGCIRKTFCDTNADGNLFAVSKLVVIILSPADCIRQIGRRLEVGQRIVEAALGFCTFTHSLGAFSLVQKNCTHNTASNTHYIIFICNSPIQVGTTIKN